MTGWRTNMEYTVLGRTGFKVSKLGLGGAPLGGDFGETSDEIVFNVIQTALDLGINFIDTAPLYGKGESERRIGNSCDQSCDERRPIYV
jgi:L-galactose dehydrogenase